MSGAHPVAIGAAPEGAMLLADEAATAELGAVVAAEVGPGDLVALHGGIGAGKTTLARAILRAHLSDPGLDVPSPTFTLVQAYDGPRGLIVHADLYRVAGEGELFELGFDEWGETAALIVEWPERAPSMLNRPRLDIRLSLDPETGGRWVVLSGRGPLPERIARRRAIDALTAEAGWAEATRAPMSGDASARSYERLVKPSGESAIVMISPPRPDGPAVRRGKPYSAIARLAESVHAFVAVDRGLRAEGFSAPKILAKDLETGLLLIEDFGTGPFVTAGTPIPDRYAEATRCLAALHARSLPETLPVAAGIEHALPPYDLDAMMIEVELLPDWYAPLVGGSPLSGSAQAEFCQIWRDILGGLDPEDRTWTLRDVHSPNLIWLPDRQGIARVGLLDFQDAVLGPPAYDVASLLQDARVTVSPELELRLLGIYAGARRGADRAFDMNGFATAYAIMAAQRATKILGIFARLNRRDGKPDYLRHLPRIRAYLARNLEHPALARLKDWFETRMPAEFGRLAEPPLLTGEQDSPAIESALQPAPRLVAMVLAAGLGRRMRPLTDERPKPLVEVAGRPLIDHALARLREAGITRVVVNVHHLAGQIEAHLAGIDGMDVTISDERDALLETGGGVRRALPHLGPSFIVMNSDSLWAEPPGAANLAALLSAWRPHDMDALLLLAPVDSLGYDGRGDFTLDADGRLTRRHPEGDASHVYAGVAILTAGSFADAPEDPFSLNLIFDRALAAGRLHGHVLTGEWLHVGTPEAVVAAETRLAAIEA